AIAKKALEDRLGTIRSRAIARAAIKFALAKLAEEETTKQAGQAWGFLAGLTARAAGAALEVADTRCWSTIPAQIRMARVRAPARPTSAPSPRIARAPGLPASSPLTCRPPLPRAPQSPACARSALPLGPSRSP